MLVLFGFYIHLKYAIEKSLRIKIRNIMYQNFDETNILIFMSILYNSMHFFRNNSILIIFIRYLFKFSLGRYLNEEPDPILMPIWAKVREDTQKPPTADAGMMTKMAERRVKMVNWGCRKLLSLLI